MGNFGPKNRQWAGKGVGRRGNEGSQPTPVLMYSIKPNNVRRKKLSARVSILMLRPLA